jgi:tight adherence protein C
MTAILAFFLSFLGGWLLFRGRTWEERLHLPSSPGWGVWMERARRIFLRSRLRRLRREALPEFLDLLVLSLEGGYNLHRSFELAADKASPALAEVLGRARDQVLLGWGYGRALQKVALEEGLPELHALGRTVRTAELLGTPLAESLRELASEWRWKRRQETLARLELLPLKITLVAALLLFPPVLLLVLLPNVALFFRLRW